MKAEPFIPHAGQIAPLGEWSTWVLRGGRGSGMTRAAVEWLLERARQVKGRRMHLMGASRAAAFDMLVEGPSGILACAHPGEVDSVTPRLVRFASGARAVIYGADDPEDLRGSQCDTLVADDVGHWGPGAATAMAAAMFGLRLGDARRVVTVTGKLGIVAPLIRRMPLGVVVTSSTTYDNRDHLAPAFVAACDARPR